MPPAPTAESGSYRRPYTKTAGTEPLPGYRLLDPLGRGGFGEVWRCEAPGGLLKAIKFVSGAPADDGQGERRFTQELDAFQQIKAIRHPFLLTLERVEVIAGELVMVMELADRQLQDRFRECRTCGLPGIPRDELLAYFADAAEALDMIAAKYGLQHLDVKPANLFLVAGHVKVGDYGLVARLDPDGPASRSRGLTPKYVSPEALRGEPSTKSDQYSLALVYHELLTGTFPYAGRSAQQMMMHHISTKPDLSALPPVDQPIVTHALAKNPAERYGSCLAFIQALMSVANGASLPGAAMEVRRARVDRSRAEIESLPMAEALEMAEALDAEDPTGGRPQAEVTQNMTLPGVPNLTVPGRNNPAPPKLVPAAKPKPSAAPAEPKAQSRRFAVTLKPIRSVVPVSRLHGVESSEVILSAAEFARAVVEHAADGARLPEMPGDIGRLADGTWVCQFPSTIPPTVLPMKIGVLRETWGLALEQPEPNRLVLRYMCAGGGLWGAISGKKPSGFAISIGFPPPGRMVGELTVTGRIFGSPDGDFLNKAHTAIPDLIMEIRRELKNVEDRRKHPRVGAGFAITLYPIHSDGGIDVPLQAMCRDVSLGGLCFTTDVPPPTKYHFAVFDEIELTTGQAILIRLVRSQAVNRECVCGAQYRTDL
jgi:serine/threonine protein kinase